MVKTWYLYVQMQDLLRMQELDGLEHLKDDVTGLVLFKSAFTVQVNVQIFLGSAERECSQKDSI